MASVQSFRGILVGDKIICNVSSYFCYGKVGTVEKIIVNEGDVNGWFKVKSEDGGEFLLAGEEIRKY